MALAFLSQLFGVAALMLALRLLLCGLQALHQDGLAMNERLVFVANALLISRLAFGQLHADEGTTLIKFGREATEVGVVLSDR